MTVFNQAFQYLLVNEGSEYTNNPSDAGGPTKFGVTQKSYSAYFGRPISSLEMMNLTPDQAQQFYLFEYWRPLLCALMSHAATAICIFDTAVLYGPGTSVRMAQKTASIAGATIKLDGLIGDETVKALNIIPPGDFVPVFHDQILDRISQVIDTNPQNEVFRKGWTARADRLLTLLTISDVP